MYLPSKHTFMIDDLLFLTFQYNPLVNYEEKLREMKLAVESFESHPNGYISQGFLENDVEELHDLDQSKIASLDSVKEDLQTMKSFLSDMESKFQSG